jgi:hypothetical protein
MHVAPTKYRKYKTLGITRGRVRNRNKEKQEPLNRGNRPMSYTLRSERGLLHPYKIRVVVEAIEIP